MFPTVENPQTLFEQVFPVVATALTVFAILAVNQAMYYGGWFNNRRKK